MLSSHLQTLGHITKISEGATGGQAAVVVATHHVLQNVFLFTKLMRPNHVLRGQQIVPISNPCNKFRPNGINGDFWYVILGEFKNRMKPNNFVLEFCLGT